MKRTVPWQLEILAVVFVAGLVLFSGRVGAVDQKPVEIQFTQPTIDVGCFVSDPDKSVKFYTDVVGFREVSSFTVPADMCKATGLTEGKPLVNIRVLVLGEGPGATKLKLSSIADQKAKQGDTAVVSSQYGFRYITLHVADQNALYARLKKAGVKPITAEPAPLPKSLAEGVYLTTVKDPDGNLIEFVGPKK